MSYTNGNYYVVIGDGIFIGCKVDDSGTVLARVGLVGDSV